jgi:phage I-like protein
MNTFRPLLLNRDFKLPADGWHHVVPLGEFMHPQTKTVQVLDNRAAEEIVRVFRADAQRPNFPGVLVDFDHFSEDADKPSEAAGWITALDNRADGVWAQIRWSDLGEAAVNGGRYRLVSPVFPPPGQCEDAGPVATMKNSRKRPLKLVRLALTNDPNLKGMVPLSNRAEPGGSAEQVNTHTKDKMKGILTLLGLSAEATEDAAIGEVNKLKNRVTALETENKSLLAGQVESDLEKYKNRFKPEAKEKVKAQLLANRAATLELLEIMPEVTPSATAPAAKPMHNRQAAGTPSVEINPDDAQGKAREAEGKVEEFRLQNRCTYEQARNAVRRRNPELFGLDKS